MNEKQKLGKWGEAQASVYLQDKGLEILHLNERTRYGEIDLVALDGDEVVFVEVKTRSSNSFGAPEMSVNPRKQKHLIDSASAIIQNHPELADTWRIDVLSINGSPEMGLKHIEWFQNAIG
jgi:putative endonuclease